MTVIVPTPHPSLPSLSPQHMFSFVYPYLRHWTSYTLCVCIIMIVYAQAQQSLGWKPFLSYRKSVWAERQYRQCTQETNVNIFEGKVLDFLIVFYRSKKYFKLTLSGKSIQRPRLTLNLTLTPSPATQTHSRI